MAAIAASVLGLTLLLPWLLVVFFSVVVRVERRGLDVFFAPNA
jgi:hypothetical protein